MKKFIPTHLELYGRPDSYMGPNFEDFYVVLGQNRDSSCLARCNFEVAKGEFKPIELNENDWCVKGQWYFPTKKPIIVRQGHWACGWIELILIHKDAGAKLLKKADALAERLDNYPVLNEDLYSQKRYEESSAYWENLSIDERVDYCKQAGLSIFAARSVSIPSNDGHLDELLDPDRC